MMRYLLVAKQSTLYGDRGDDKIIVGTDVENTAFGGSGDDYLEATFGDNTLYGDKGEDTFVSSGSETTTYIGGEGADNFVCGDGIDTITDFNAAEGDTKTADCENFLSNLSPLNDNNDTIGTASNPSGETVENFPSTEEDVASDPPTTTTMAKTATTTTTSSNNEIETETETTAATDKQEQEY